MWFHHLPKLENDTFQEVIKEIDSTDSDRAAAIVAASFVENHLTILIQSFLEQDESLLKKSFRISGPLGNFAVKIDLGHLLRIYSRAAWKELDSIKEIRNAFAHRMEVGSFQHNDVEKFTGNLTLWETKKIILSLKDGIKIGSRLVIKFGDHLDLEDGKWEMMMFDTIPAGMQIPNRERFINACKFHIAAFNVVINLPRMHRKPLF